MQLYWHRRNLRPHPNRGLSVALTAARRDGSTAVPLFVLDDRILSHADSMGVAFMICSLRTLREWYRDRGSDIAIRHGDPTAVVTRLAGRPDVDRVVWNRDHSPLARERDGEIERALTRTDAAYTAVRQRPPAAEDGSNAHRPDPDSYLAHPSAVGIETRRVPALSDLDAVTAEPAPLTLGTDAAEKRLEALSNGTTHREGGRETAPSDGRLPDGSLAFADVSL